MSAQRHTAATALDGGGRRDRTLAPFGRRLLTVTRNERLGAYRLLWAADEGPEPAPGQFAMIAAAERWGAGADERPYVPRAFSIAARSGSGESAFLLEDVGPGTKRLCELRPGEGLWALSPLGRGFSPTPPEHRTILVGGGVGIAPLAILQAQLLRDAGAEARPAVSVPRGEGGGAEISERRPTAGVPGDVIALLGFRDAAHAEGAALLADAQVATDDGSVGHRGLVTELLEGRLHGAATPTVVRACGPPPMLEAVRALCERLEVPAELALEAGMACGYGSCFGCVVPRRGGGYLRVCLDGPALDACELERVQ